VLVTPCFPIVFSKVPPGNADIIIGYHISTREVNMPVNNVNRPDRVEQARVQERQYNEARVAKRQAQKEEVRSRAAESGKGDGTDIVA